MSTLEITILTVLGLLLLGANSLASLRAIRTLRRYAIPYLALIWLTPFVGAVYVLAKIRPQRTTSAFTPLASNTIGLDNNPVTIQGDPWPTISPPTHSPTLRRK
jgi:phosphoglycerol transferase MdoB-like AlkP superfamily enzyme